MNIRLFSNGTCRNKVAAIKAIRAMCGIGLKEAKDAIEGAIDGNVVNLTITPAYAGFLLDGKGDEYETLRLEGFVFSGIATKRTAVLAALRDSAKVALMSKDYDLSVSIINVLKEHDFEQ